MRIPVIVVLSIGCSPSLDDEVGIDLMVYDSGTEPESSCEWPTANIYAGSGARVTANDGASGFTLRLYSREEVDYHCAVRKGAGMAFECEGIETTENFNPMSRPAVRMLSGEFLSATSVRLAHGVEILDCLNFCEEDHRAAGCRTSWTTSHVAR